MQKFTSFKFLINLEMYSNPRFSITKGKRTYVGINSRSLQNERLWGWHKVFKFIGDPKIEIIKTNSYNEFFLDGSENFYEHVFVFKKNKITHAVLELRDDFSFNDAGEGKIYLELFVDSVTERDIDCLLEFALPRKLESLYFKIRNEIVCFIEGKPRHGFKEVLNE